MNEGQEICFACGQHIRQRGHRGERPHSPIVFILAGVLVLAVGVGAVFVVGGRARRAAGEAVRQKQAQLDEAARAAAEAKRDSTRAAVRSDAMGALVQEVNDLESRFNLVRKEVVRDQPSPAQAKLISQISAELGRLRQLAAVIGDQPSAGSDSLKEQLRNGERTVRSLISALSRAPKK
ncbi:hypothetical protein FJY68_06445 [candidate division WOR-3 bacterium]|uniref:Uncharacterized protein n=1 Tax=candidate division WOR-3 bacterium TaxID=2052148 RepID=A0A937XH09_UNCW3|nr:hypothetical protein [candidate division WOR-3 bacterium]